VDGCGRLYSLSFWAFRQVQLLGLSITRWASHEGTGNIQLTNLAQSIHLAPITMLFNMKLIILALTISLVRFRLVADALYKLAQVPVSGRNHQGSEALSFFLGKYNVSPEDDNIVSPSKTMDVPPSTSRVVISFDAYQLGSWTAIIWSLVLTCLACRLWVKQMGGLRLLTLGISTRMIQKNTITMGWSVTSSLIEVTPVEPQV
jgi:hypothetical protein